MDCRHVQFRDRPDCLDLPQLQALFNRCAFWAQDRSLEDLATALRHSSPVVSVWDGDRLIGFARATSDGIYRAMIWDVVVDEAYRGAGLGRKLVETILAHPQVQRVERVYLMTTHQQAFYERIGFETNQSTTLVFYNAAAELLVTPEAQPAVGSTVAA